MNVKLTTCYNYASKALLVTTIFYKKDKESIFHKSLK